MIAPLLGQLASNQDCSTISEKRGIGSADLDRKILADVAMHEAEAFSAIIVQAKSAMEEKAA
jgi:ribosomal protein L20